MQVAYGPNKNDVAKEFLAPSGLISSTVSDAKSDEWRARVELAACYRILDGLGMNEGCDNHLTVMLKGEEHRFLCIAYGVLWSEVTASNLLLLNDEGEVLKGSGAPDPTAFYIHSRIHKAHPHAKCVLHTHMPHATALCCLQDMTLKMIHQNSIRFYQQIAYDTEYRGLILGKDEGDRLASVMGDKRVLLHKNHGVITTGDTIAEAFDEMYYLERAAQVQILAASTHAPLAYIDDDIAANYKDEVDKYRGVWAEKHFEARKRVLFKPTAMGQADFAA